MKILKTIGATLIAGGLLLVVGIVGGYEANICTSKEFVTFIVVGFLMFFVGTMILNKEA